MLLFKDVLMVQCRAAGRRGRQNAPCGRSLSQKRPRSAAGSIMGALERENT